MVRLVVAAALLVLLAACDHQRPLAPSSAGTVALQPVGAGVSTANATVTDLGGLPGSIGAVALSINVASGATSVRVTAKEYKFIFVPRSVRHGVVTFRITNTGKAPWQKATGLLSVWILGMFPPSPTAIVVIPFRPGPPASLGPVVNDAYFGKVPADRLAVDRNVLFFRADGQYRGKIGLSPRRAKPLLGSYDSANGILTLVQYTLPAGITDYVNSMWEIQKDPYGGDTVNSYNDGPPQPGAKPLGPFYEIETSSPAAALAPGSSLVHMHRTFHFVGSDRDLDPIVRATLGVGLDEIRKALPAR